MTVKKLYLIYETYENMIIFTDIEGTALTVISISHQREKRNNIVESFTLIPWGHRQILKAGQ